MDEAELFWVLLVLDKNLVNLCELRRNYWQTID